MSAFKKVEKAGWNFVQLCTCILPSGQDGVAVQAERQGEARLVRVHETFTTQSEAEAWIQYAM